MSKIAAPLFALKLVMNKFTETSIRSAELANLSQKTDVELARMGVNRSQLVHNVFSGYHYA